MDELAALTGRRYRLVEYSGDPQAERVVVVMGSGAQTVAQTVDHLRAGGERVGVLQLRLYRPFPVEEVLAAIPAACTRLAVLDRTKEPGAGGEPLFLDVVSALGEAVGTGRRERMPLVVGGRYGLSSKEFTPGMVAGIFAELALPSPRPRFTVGITDDVTGLSLPYPADLDVEHPQTTRAIFYGLGSDGTVGANKNTIKILGARDGTYAQGYFVYDSKKSGSRTVSHLRFGPTPITAPYLVSKAGFIGCHHWSILEGVDVLRDARPGTVLLLNSPLPPDEVFSRLPLPMQQRVIDLGVELWTIDAGAVARAAGMGQRTNTVLQTCFFAISRVMPRDAAIEAVKQAIGKSYALKGPDVVARNEAAVDTALANLHQVAVPAAAVGEVAMRRPVPDTAPEFVRDVTAMMLTGQGDDLPVSALPVDGTYPSGTTQYEKRNISDVIAVWDADACIQCGSCAFVCPHAVLRAKYYPEAALQAAPASFQTAPLNAAGLPEAQYTLQVYAEDCTGCGLCVEVCPVRPLGSGAGRKAINLEPRLDRSAERENVAFFETIPVNRRSRVDFAGQTSTHTPHPVQSSGATWIDIHCPWTSFDRNALERNPAGAPARAAGS
jgi:pyruvate-ferredoxin/flavodoxin oxidoreductase